MRYCSLCILDGWWRHSLAAVKSRHFAKDVAGIRMCSLLHRASLTIPLYRTIGTPHLNTFSQVSVCVCVCLSRLSAIWSSAFGSNASAKTDIVDMRFLFLSRWSLLSAFSSFPQAHNYICFDTSNDTKAYCRQCGYIKQCRVAYSWFRAAHSFQMVIWKNRMCTKCDVEPTTRRTRKGIRARPSDCLYAQHIEIVVL